MEQTELISTLHGKKEMYTKEDMIEFAKFAVDAHVRSEKSGRLSDQSARAYIDSWIRENSLRVIWKGEELRPGDNFEVDENKVVTVRFQLP